MSGGRQVVEVVDNATITYESFHNFIHTKRQPIVFKSLNIGSCVDKWTWEYLKQTCGSRKVKVHVSATPQMDFITKNFIYRSLQFDEFIDRICCDEQTSCFICKDEKYYLRSLGEDPRIDVADIRKDFPELANDIIFPDAFEPNKFFSSVFRISSRGVQLWTHYDVMDNLLLMVSGTKRVVLYEPNDALFMYLQDDKSRVLDIDNPDPDVFPEFFRAIPYDCVLQPGDVLFIPALWFHNVINLDAGVAVNVFWRHLEECHYDRTDTYGNKDLVIAARATQGIDRAVKLLESLPREYRDFYTRKLITRIQLRSGLVSSTGNNQDH